MLSDKYLFTPHAKVFVTRGTTTNKYTGETALHFSYHCPVCDKDKLTAKFVEETGSYVREVVLKCACGIIYHYSV